jgi:hypothetical protein
MGVIVGHLIGADAVLPVNGGLVVFFALFGGAFGQFFNGGVSLTLVKLLPSYWLASASKAALLKGAWPAEGWIVVAVWTACGAGAAGRAGVPARHRPGVSRQSAGKLGGR